MSQPDENNNPLKKPPRDRELRARVRLFGNLLGTVLRDQAGGKVLAAVEALRKGYIRLRHEDSPRLRQRLSSLIERLEPEVLTDVVRAFNVYFSLVNIAEEAFEHRQRRRAIRTGGPLWRGSFDDTLREFHGQGMEPDQFQRLLDQTLYVPVFTAHPTESKRRTVMEALRRIFITGERLYGVRLNKEEREEVIGDLRRQIQILWKTDEVRVHRPRVRDEIRNGLFYFRESLFTAVPTTYRNLEKAVDRIYGQRGEGAAPVSVPSLLRFGSWIGGDRDGNPNVKPETTRLAIRLQMREALCEYLRRTEALGHILTHSILLCQPSEAFMDGLHADEQRYSHAFGDHVQRFSHEPYRRKLHIMRYRLRRNLQRVSQLLEDASAEASGEDCYGSEAGLLDDLYAIRDSLYSHGDGNIADRELKDFIRLVETFGFYLLQLDVRQESSRHTAAVAEVVSALPGTDDNYDALDEAGRVELLCGLLAADELPAPDRAGLSEATAETLEVFDVMRTMRGEVSPQAFGSYVISMTHTASHVLEVMVLARLAGLAGRDDDGWFCHIRISPLFETIDDLEHIEDVLVRLLDQPVYRELLGASGNLQEVMLGYSDSCKDGGILASAWNLYEAQKKILAITGARGIDCRLFHGRGGTIGRGGGPTHESILAQPPDTVHGQIKFTEQGEVLSYKYSNAETAVYELTMGVTGLLKASRCLVQPPAVERRDHLGIMDELARIGEEAYRGLTDRTEGFLDYFYEVTPVQEIALLNIGSRPSHRAQTDRSKSSIRAIPWVFGWAQSRHTLPAWYGIGYALEQWRDNDPARLATLQTMYREWPFFRALLSNTQMSLFKADMDLAWEYATTLAKDAAGAGRIYRQIREEYERTLVQILNVTNAHVLLEENPSLFLSLSRRNPYLDPLNHIQLTLLGRYRDSSAPEAQREQWRDPLLRSINAIAGGQRNTG